MSKALSLLTTLLLSFVIFSQKNPIYDSLVKEAKARYEKNDFIGSANLFSKAFESNGWKANPYSRYFAVCSWARANVLDSAFSNLIVYVDETKFSDLKKLNNDPDLYNLFGDRRWHSIIKRVKRNKRDKEKHFDWRLIRQLEAIRKDDQFDRSQIDHIRENYGNNSKEMDSLWKIIEYKDSLNVKKVCAILDKNGWLSPRIVGGDGVFTVFLVIQHADIKTQEIYLPIMREASKRGDLEPSDLAMLEDRVALKNNRNQIYGTQIGYDETNGIYYLLPVDDPDNLDKRRSQVNLDSIDSYVIDYGIIWNLEEYKRNLPFYEELQKQ